MSLQQWLDNDADNTAHELQKVFGERSFAILYLLLMALPSLPIPTGGITHVFEVICMLVALEQLIGMRSFWLPQSAKHRPLPDFFIQKVLPLLQRRITWFEHHSRRRGTTLLNNRWFMRLSGLVVLAGAVNAFVAPPFSGLDTLPSMGVVTLALGIIAGDIAWFFAGTGIVIGSVILNITIGRVVFAALRRFVLHGSTEVRLLALAALVLVVVALVIKHRSSQNK